MEKYNPVGKFLVISDSSGHTAKKRMMQLHSCDIVGEESASSWAKFIKATDLNGRAHKRKRVFVVQIVEVIEPDA